MNKPQQKPQKSPASADASPAPIEQKPMDPQKQKIVDPALAFHPSLLWKRHAGSIARTLGGIWIPMIVPLVLWDRIPDGQWMSWSGRSWEMKALILGLPPVLISLTFLWIVGLVFRKEQQIHRDSRTLSLLFWMFPLLSWIQMLILYCFFWGLPLSVSQIVSIGVGALLIITGNLLPKVRPNPILGVRLPWTLADPDNWTYTHRFTGYLWVAGGAVLVLGSLLAEASFPVLMMADVLIMAAAPVVYSWSRYRRQLQAGQIQPLSAHLSKSTRWVVLITGILLAGVGVLLGTGTIEARWNAPFNQLTLQATYWPSTVLEVDDIQRVEMDDSFSFGSRTLGLANFRIAAGSFSNEELGAYTLYAPADARQVVLITLNNGQHYAVALADPEQTEALYDQLVQILDQRPANSADPGNKYKESAPNGMKMGEDSKQKRNPASKRECSTGTES